MMRHALALVLVPIISGCAAAGAQTPAAQPQPPAATSPDQDRPFIQEELDQMLAPIALYPDSLLSQVLMAATYPLEIVQADRWVMANKGLQGDALANALEQKDWDPSVKSLTNFPDVLSMLSDRLEWTRKLGDAFIGQQQQVLDTVQKLRQRAKDAGTLQTTNEQVVRVEQTGPAPTIIIEQAAPDVIYVPAYNPEVVYGTWWYPAYPPYPYWVYPYSGNYISFGLGIGCGVAWGYAWGHCDWDHHYVDVDIHRNHDFNHHIDRNRYERPGFPDGRGRWEHSPDHRRGVGYRDNATAQRYGGRSAPQARMAREAYRGRAEAGRQDISRRGPEAVRGTPPTRPSTGRTTTPSTRPSTGRTTTPSTRPSTGRTTTPSARPSTGRTSPSTPRPSAQPTSPRPSTPGYKRSTPSPRPSGGALNGVNRGGTPARAGSSRGTTSRSATGSRSGATRSSGGRSSGGRSR